MKTRVVVLGAGFGGLELMTRLSDAFGDAIDILLVDKGDTFVFGFSKLDVMFGRQVPPTVCHSYRDIVKPGVRLLQSAIQSIDPAAKRVVTDDGAFSHTCFEEDLPAAWREGQAAGRAGCETERLVDWSAHEPASRS